MIIKMIDKMNNYAFINHNFNHHQNQNQNQNFDYFADNPIFYNYLFVSESCLVCGQLTNSTMRIKGRFYYLCKKHCNLEDLENFMVKKR